MNENKNAYITLFSNEDYIYCILGLYSSWKQQEHKYPFYCACTEDIKPETINILKGLGINILMIPTLEYSKTLKANNIRRNMQAMFFRALPKLQIWSLNQFDKLVYLDADTFIFQNLDDLFEKPHMSGVVDLAFLKADNPDWEIDGDKWFRYFNAGMLVIEPQEGLTNKIVDFMEWLPLDRNWSDQAILQAYYRNWPSRHNLHLSVYYNVLASALDVYESYGWFEDKNIKLMHFVDKYKPVPALWKDEVLTINGGRPYLHAAIAAYFNFINDYILECKENNLLPSDFKTIGELKGKKENTNAK